MTATLNALTAALVSLAFAAALAGMVTMTTDAARSIAGASAVATYGSTMPFPASDF